MNNGANRASIKIRTPRMDDLQGIVSVVRACEPYLTAHMSYIYWMQIRHCGDTCVVAVMGGEIVGWCSILPGSRGKYFVHQLGVAPRARRQGLAQSLLAHVVNKLNNQPAARPELEFTIDRRNGAALDLVKAVAGQAGMQLRKTPEPVGLLEEGCAEDLYVMTPVAKRRADVSSEVHIKWTTTEATATNELSF
ncbi:MAG: N-acetyltransferase family protein [Bryobacteraceae bacterium]